MIFTEYPNDFWHKRKINNFDPYNVLLAIATNIHVLLMTAFVIIIYIYIYIYYYYYYLNEHKLKVVKHDYYS